MLLMTVQLQKYSVCYETILDKPYITYYYNIQIYSARYYLQNIKHQSYITLESI